MLSPITSPQSLVTSHHLPVTSHQSLIFMVAGEASGDLHGANLIKALRQILPEVTIFGIGGPRMRAAGLHPVYAAEKLAVVGLTEVLAHLKDIWLAWQRAKEFFLRKTPSLFIPIDYPDFNLRLAALAKKCKVPVLYYISPQIWAWRKRRVKKIARLVNEMAVILPFEKDFYLRHGVKATFVGHPLLDIMPLPQTTEEPLIGLLPGSRVSEIKHILPVMLRTAAFICRERPDLKFILPVAPTLNATWLKTFMNKYQPELPITLSKNNYEAIQRCCFLLVASGTATLETAILLKPFVIIYRLSPFSYTLGKRLVKVPYIGLVNWVAGKKIIPEFIQEEAKPEIIAQTVLDALAHPEKIRQIKKDLSIIRTNLGSPGVAPRVAQIAKRMLRK